jgi:hypothetical protein
MLFRRRSRSHDSPVVQIVGDCSVQVSPSRTTKPNKSNTLGESFILSKGHPPSFHNRDGSPDEGYQSNSSPDQSPQQRKEHSSNRIPTSRKTGFATIQTESTDAHPAFESDAFAVLMPTTRLPILDRTISPPKPASAAARAHALKTYQEKAQQNRESNNSQGVKVPSRLMSYDYTAHRVADTRTSTAIEARTPTPAGSFPISPPLPQRTWARAERATEVKLEGARHVNSVSNTATVLKPVTVNTSTTTSRYRIYRPDSTAGASRSPGAASTLPPTITVRVKSRPKVSTPEIERVQPKSTHNLYSLPYDVSPLSSRSPSPVKTMPNFTRHNSVEGDSIFGYKSKDTDGAVAGASPTRSSKAKDQAKPKAAEKPAPKLTPTDTNTPKRTLTSRWPWLRPVSPRIAKPTTAPVVFSTPPPPPPHAAGTIPKPRPMSGYVDPFERLATPVPPTPAPTARPSTPKKVLAKPAPKPPAVPNPPTPAHKSTPAPPSPTGKFDTGFAQIKALGLILLKFCLLVYAAIALWFVLDAVREVWHTIGVPFRAVRWVAEWIWFGVCWVGGIVGAVVCRR